MKNKIEIRKQKKKDNLFYGILKKDEIIDASICNPPFYASWEEVEQAFQKKIKNLKRRNSKREIPNFGGQSHELWCNGGEAGFISHMIVESGLFPTSCFWFSTLVSKKSNLKYIYEKIHEVKAVEAKTIEMGQGNKWSRIVAWTFLNKKQQAAWAAYRWRK